ncbi:MAG TPA: L-threonylcarbamoyladenylate synthase [Acidimicrobiia bacterium]
MPARADVEQAVAVLRRGGLVAFPTETVYGLGCDVTNVDALARLFEVKRRPRHHPVILHLASADSLADWAVDVSPAAKALAEACWPGPLTIVLRRSARVPDAVTGGGETVGVRVPDQPLALALLRAFGSGIAAPSANRFGRVSPTTAADVRADLGTDVDVVLDGGPCTVGVESTIVDCTREPPVILRLGGVDAARIEAIVGEPPTRSLAGEIAAPGTLPTHYAPAARVLLAAPAEVAAGAADMIRDGRRVGLLAPRPLPADLPAELVVLDPPADAADYARHLYARLREADRLRLDVLIAVPPADEGIGAAVADRLERASAR